MHRAITITELNEYVKRIFTRDAVLNGIRVRGEISGFKRHSSGHLYFSLKDAGALIRCVMFRQDAYTLSFAPLDGMQVIAEGSVSLYVRDGQYQLYVHAMEKEGQGELYRQYLELKDALEREGYFDAAHKKGIPFLPACVGIVTSPTGAAIKDITEIAHRRFPKMRLLLCPVLVQGAGATESIADGIRRMNADGRASVLIVGRGGGSLEDLFAFNTKEVAEAIYKSDIPVISAVGHETDYTIADFVADLRAPTPSAAAELAVPEFAVLMQRLDELTAMRLPMAAQRGLSVRKERLGFLLHGRGFSVAEHRIAGNKQILNDARYRLAAAFTNAIGKRKQALEGKLLTLRAIRPQAALERGYAIVSDEKGEMIKSVDRLTVGMPVLLYLQDGHAEANITGSERNAEKTNI